MNRIILLGRLVRDPEFKLTPNCKEVCTFTLAVDRPFKNKDGKYDADFVNCQVWGKTAELCGNSLNKGNRLLIEGRLQIRSYIAKDSAKKYATEVVGDRVEFIERKSSGTTKAAAAPASQPSQDYPESNMDGFGQADPWKEPSEPDEEIPF